MWQSILTIITLVFALNSPLAMAQDVPGGFYEPPPMQFSTAPDVVVVPSGDAYVYMVPGQSGFYFYGGYWYRFWEGRWYRAGFYNGPWGYVDVGIVPGVIVGVPPEYPLFLAPGYRRIHYGDLYGHWRAWDHDRYWHRQEWFRHEMRSDIIRDRHFRAERERVHIHERERASLGSGGHFVDPARGRTITTTRTTTIDHGKGGATSTTTIKKHTTPTQAQGLAVSRTTRSTTVQHGSNQGNKSTTVEHSSSRSTQHSGDSHQGEHKGDKSH